MWNTLPGRLTRCVRARCLHSFPQHPHKSTVTSLLHQRPFERVELPSLVSSLTLMQPQIRSVPGESVTDDCTYGSAVYASAPKQYDADYKHLSELCQFFHTPP